ncbi:MAG: hypothetical protein AAF573_20680, partial [Bacteroidota bacterium]
DQAMKLLQKVEFKDIFHNLNARKMQLRMYYELNELDALESFLDSFERYLKRHKELGYHKEHHLNLIRVVRKMIRIPKFQKSAIQQLREEVRAEDGLIDKRWILAQLGFDEQ